MSETIVNDLATEHIESIVESISDDQKVFSTFGYSSGMLGKALLLYYYANFSENEKYAHIANQIVSEAYKVSMRPYKGYNFYRELSELGIFTEYLRKNELIYLENDKTLEEIDFLMQQHKEQSLQKKDFDPITGVLCAGKYFLSRANTSANAQQNLASILTGIYQIRKEDANGDYFWESKLFDDDRIYLGITHGSAAIILFASKMVEMGILPNIAKEIIEKGTKYLLNQLKDFDKEGYAFADIVGEEPQKTRLGLCYGDMGTAYGILRGAAVLENNNFYEKAIEVFKHSTTRLNPTETGVKDASILYGASGVALIYDKVYELTQEKIFDNAARYWYEQITAFAIHDNNTAGYKGIFNQKNPQTNISLMEGIAGIGCTLIKYSERDNYNFNELIGLI